MDNSCKILVLGQGLAGTVLARTLQQKGAVVSITDPFNIEGWGRGERLVPPSLPASVVAAGIINPVTGKRFAKSWRFDDFFPAARQWYGAFEKSLGVNIWQELPILRLLASNEEENDWAARCAMPDFAVHLAMADGAAAWTTLLKPGFRFGQILQAARVELLPLLRAYRQLAQREGFFLRQPIPAKMEHLLLEYDFVVYCEGAGSAYNPYFAQLPWVLSKGEALLIRFENPGASAIQQMLKKKIMVAPLGDGLFWCGSPYEWHFDDALPSPHGKAFIEDNLQDMLAGAYETVDHLAAVRPTVKDRRPFIGLLPTEPRIGIFNGLGTKGALLAPYWANHFAEHLLEGRELDATVDVRRFLVGKMPR